MNGANPLAKLNAATAALAQCETPAEAVQIANLAEAARKYAKKARLGLDVQNHAAELKIRAERKVGELLIAMAENGQRQVQGGDRKSNSHDGSLIPTLSDLDINDNQSSRCQAIARIPLELMEQWIAEIVAEPDELTSKLMMRFRNELVRDEVRDAKASAPPIEGIYRVWYADPPWQYNNSGVIGDTDHYGHVGRHYPSMSIAALCAMGEEIKEHTTPDAVLFLWVTSPLLEASFAVIRAWGFEYKTSFVWDKIAHNFGHYNSVRHELLLVCTRGSCTPDDKTLHDSVISIERSEKHSQKPEAFRLLIENLYSWGNRVELFARETAPGWAAWGNEPTEPSG